MIPLHIVHFEPNSIMRSPFSAGLHADGLSLWQREALCNELRWFFYNPFWFLKRRLITRVFMSICTRRSQEHDDLLRELLHDSSSP